MFIIIGYNNLHKFTQIKRSANRVPNHKFQFVTQYKQYKYMSTTSIETTNENLDQKRLCTFIKYNFISYTNDFESFLNPIKFFWGGIKKVWGHTTLWGLGENHPLVRGFGQNEQIHKVFIVPNRRKICLLD